MSDNTIIQQGYFTSTGVDKIIPLRSDVDWVDVYNLTNIAAGAQWAGIQWHWQREMAQDDAILYYHAAATQAMYASTAAVGFNGAVYRGISLIDSSNIAPSATRAVTAGTNATQPVYSTANTTGLNDGTIVRVQNTAHTNLNGLDFSIDTIVAATSFRLANTLQQAPGVIAGAAGTYRVVAPNVATYNMFYPKSRVIANITQAAAAVVTTLVDHSYQSGQKVRMIIPDGCGMTELNGLIGVVTVLNASTFSINIDTTGFTAFVFRLPAAVPFTHAQVVPVGDANYTLTGATVNNSFIGMVLGTSAVAAIALASPGGTNGDIIKWVAGKSFATHIG
jgi:hypothetical protein